MLAETRAYFRELIDENLTADYLVKSDFAMLNGKLAAHYGIAGVSGSRVRRVPLPADSPRGGFLTQSAILKVTANGTTTSPVPRGAFVIARLLGQPPDPPPPNIPAIDPDVRGATTIREQLAKHRAQTVVRGLPREDRSARLRAGGVRRDRRLAGSLSLARVRATRPRAGNIDPFLGISFKLGPPVESGGVLPDGRAFSGIIEFQSLLAADRDRLLINLARQLAVYATGRGLSFADRDAIAAVVAATNEGGGGMRTLIHELVQSRLFRAR